MFKMRDFSEDIYGNLATVYHRTKFSDLINAVYTSGFKPGSGDMYGKGFYSTYELVSQERAQMKDYGKIVVKFSVKIKNFFIFDYSEFVKSPNFRTLKSTEENFILDQINYFGISMFKSFDPQKSVRFSSNSAFFIFKNSNIMKCVDGMIFTGEHDGKVLLAYNTGLIIPLAYKVDGSDEFEKVERNKEYFKQALLKSLAPREKPEDLIPTWFRTAKKSNETVSFDSNDLPVWKDGVWEEGTWLNGTWHDGLWKSGVWKDGTWQEGFWRSGTWETGTWYNGSWTVGAWYDGSWQTGTWTNGIWKKGTWRSGTWEDGTWISGNWENGRWHKGTWYTGTWKRGTWFTGTWTDGIWQDGTWRRGTWKKGIWKMGMWDSGTWLNGIWEDGTWMSGTWENGMWYEGRIWSTKFSKLVYSKVDPIRFKELEDTVETLEELNNLASSKSKN